MLTFISILIVDKGWHMPIQTAYASFIFAFGGLLLLIAGIILLVNRYNHFNFYPNNKSLIKLLSMIFIGLIFVIVGIKNGILKLH
jgi:hypothetical protein